jgi:phosphoserine phosphatase
MRLVLTLIASAVNGLSEDIVAVAADALNRNALDRPDWLAPGIACDLAFEGDAAASIDLECELADTLGGSPLDLAVQPAEGRRKKLLVADMDSTILAIETLDELADLAGVKAEVAAITERTMRGELDFKDAIRARVALLAGLPVDALERTFERVTLMPGARTLVRTMQAHGAYTVLVSGGFRFFTSRVRDMVGFDTDQCNDLEIVDGTLTGGLHEPILDEDSKLDALNRAIEARNIRPEDSLAVGDGANDVRMVEAAGLGVAYRGKPILTARARVNIEHGDLTALLYLQGYRRDEFRD